jgi:hypothetical protein
MGNNEEQAGTSFEDLLYESGQAYLFFAHLHGKLQHHLLQMANARRLYVDVTFN